MLTGRPLAPTAGEVHVVMEGAPVPAPATEIAIVSARGPSCTPAFRPSSMR
jgi:hypothetical protein